MKTRIRKIDGSSKWVVEVKSGCCTWTYIDPQTLEPNMPIMPYEDWFEHDTMTAAHNTLTRYEIKNGITDQSS